MQSAQKIANYFLFLADDDEGGELLSNLKLQKLVYYAQGFHLAIFDEPLFEAKIKAWQHGPVVPMLWHKYKHYGGGGIPAPEVQDFNELPASVRELLNEVYDAYGQFSAWALRNMTHEERPWREARGRGDEEISTDTMKEYFSTLIQ